MHPKYRRSSVAEWEMDLPGGGAFGFYVVDPESITETDLNIIRGVVDLAIAHTSTGRSPEGREEQ